MFMGISELSPFSMLCFWTNFNHLGQIRLNALKSMKKEIFDEIQINEVRKVI